jgi:hypothetical protein
MLPSPTTATMRTVSSRGVACPPTPAIPGEQAKPEKRLVAEREGASTGEVLGKRHRVVDWKMRAAVLVAEAEVGRVVAMGGRGGTRKRLHVAEARGPREPSGTFSS